MAIPDPRVNRFIEDKDTRISVGLQMPLGRQPGSVMGILHPLKQPSMLSKRILNYYY